MTRDPQPLSQAIARMISEYPEGSHLHDIGKTLIDAQRQSQLRRTAVLKYPALARKLTEQPLNYSRAGKWNGWIPPKLINSWSEADVLADGRGWANSLAKRARGEYENDSAQRAALVAIASEAWKLEHWSAPACLP